MNSFHFRERGGSKLPSLYKLPICNFDLRATHARTLLPAALASVLLCHLSFGFVLIVRVRVLKYAGPWCIFIGAQQINNQQTKIMLR
jgi:hypothetical protein